MPKNPAKIREQIAKLEAELKAAEREAKKKARAKIGRAAEKTGLDNLDLTAQILEREFRAIAKRHRDPSAQNETADEAPAAPACDTENEQRQPFEPRETGDQARRL